ncbi:MAG: class B sortase [Oscillospiraceae bacterium]|nr:class B sortase [Oscillospiraceae bacterium]MBQ3236504.1 class B sortase [Oscillospiraceae bacterium]
MKKIIKAAAVLLALLAVLMLCGAAENEKAGDEELPQACPIDTILENQAKQDYTHLRATRYKNLYATKYPNLMKTFEVKEEAEPSAPAQSGNWQQQVGSASNPGYSGSVGNYSLNDKTIAAHLSVQGTSVQNRAVWQAKGNTNYYTSGSVTWAAGSANLRSGELSQNTVIYGHNWGNCFVPFKKTGPEFESLMAYSYEDFVKDNQYIYLTTNSGVHTFQVFACCFTKDLSFYINCNNIDVSSIASTAMNMSLFDFGISVDDDDKIITLSTCTRYYKGLGENQRFIIMGKLID